MGAKLLSPLEQTINLVLNYLTLFRKEVVGRTRSTLDEVQSVFFSLSNLVVEVVGKCGIWCGNQTINNCFGPLRDEAMARHLISGGSPLNHQQMAATATFYRQ